MKHSITAFCDRNSDEQLILNWSGTGIGLSHTDRVIDGSRITPDEMPIVGFWEPGYRCNGGTKFTDLIMAKWAKGDIRNIYDSPDAMEFIKKLTVPSQSYAKTICRVNGWQHGGHVGEPLAKLAGVAHQTGGGVEKFKELLPLNTGAKLDKMFEPAPVLLEAQELSFYFPKLLVSDKSAHTTFHGGCGMMVVCETEKDAEILIAEAGKDSIKAKVVGNTIFSPENKVYIDSKFLQGEKVEI